MSEGQKVHRLIGIIYNGSKKTALYDDLLEDFNEGLWFGKLDKQGLIKVCQILVNDELASFVSGTHTYVENSDLASSTGIAINNNAYTAFINKKYIAGEPSAAAKRMPFIAMGAMAIVFIGYLIYQTSSFIKLRKEVDREYMKRLYDKSKTIAQKDSLLEVLQKKIGELEKKNLELTESLAKSKAATKPVKKKR